MQTIKTIQNYNVRKACFLYNNTKLLEKCYYKCKTNKEINENVKKAKRFLTDIIANNGELKIDFNHATGRSSGRKFGGGIQRHYRWPGGLWRPLLGLPEHAEPRW